MDERRSSKRWHTVLKARIVSATLSSPIECTVRDLSDAGARVYFADPSDLPKEVELEIPSKGIQVQARLIWSRGANHGLMFLQETKAWTDPVRAMVA
jgi:PilZ domain